MATNEPLGPPGTNDDGEPDLPTSIRAADASLKPPPPRSTTPGLAGTSTPPPSVQTPPIDVPRTTALGIGAPSPAAPSSARPAPVAPPPRASMPSPPAPPKSNPPKSVSVPPPSAMAESVPIEFEDVDAEEVVESVGGRRVSLASLVHLLPVGRYGNFDLLGRIAYGGMAEIFLARELQEGRPGRFVVVKRVLPHVAGDKQFVDMFTDEARLVMQLSHPNICHVYSYGREEGAPYISMEWVNGMPLSRLLRRTRNTGGFPIPMTLKIVAQIADALDHAHRAVDQSSNEPLGIVHRDVSPQNIMVSFEGSVKLLDFGIAKAASHSTRTEAGTIKGKFAYMAPEQCLGEPLDARADVFALGVVLLEMLSSGVNPFKRQTEFDTMRALVYEEARPASLVNGMVTSELDAIVAKAIAKKREDRYQSAADLGLALERELGRMGEVVNTARIGDQMNDIFREEIKAGPRLDTRIQVPRKKDEATSDHDMQRASIPAGATEKISTLGEEEAIARLAAARAAAAPVAEAPQRSRWPWVFAVLLLFGALVGGVAIVLGPSLLAAFMPPPAPIAVAPTVIAPVIAAPVIPAAPTTGTLFVDSAPGGASVSIGTRGAVGTTPMELALLDAGEWNVRLHLDGYEDWEDTVVLRAGERLRISGELTAISPGRTRPRGGRNPSGGGGGSTETEAPAAAPGRLSLNTRPWSRVYLGSRLLGTTPLGDVEVGSGTVRLRLVDRDGVEHTRSVSVPSGGHAREFFDLSSE
jgi:serine/threonine-protein kinase